jgi:hypothetical protein
MIKIRYAKSRTTSDIFPIEFRTDCDRTLFDPMTGKDESLITVLLRLDACGYDLVDNPENDSSREKTNE